MSTNLHFGLVKSTFIYLFIELAPFWNTESTYWTSAQIRNHEVFNHTYPELQNVSGNLRDHVRKQVDTLYGAPAQAIFKDIFVGNKTSMTSWSVHISIKPFTIDRSYSIVVFLDSVPKDPLQWLGSPELIGSYDVFIAYQPDECENCRAHQDVPIEGFVHLTGTLQERLAHLQSDREVTDYLAKNLYLGLIKVRDLLFLNVVPSAQSSLADSGGQYDCKPAHDRVQG